MKGRMKNKSTAPTKDREHRRDALLLSPFDYRWADKRKRFESI
jgi:hypothetical protein